MRVEVLAAIVAAVLAASPASAQVDRFRGKMVIGSTAGDALTINGGLVVGNLSDPSNQALDVRSTADGLSSGVRISRADGSYLILNMDDGGSPNAFGTLQAGDGVGFLPIRINPSGGAVLLPTGSAENPALAFTAAPKTGFHLGGSNELYIDQGGVSIVRIYASGAAPFTEFVGGAFGAGSVTGAVVTIGKNTSGGNAPGCIAFGVKGFTNLYSLWIDGSGNLRTTNGLGIGACPTESGGDTIGTVVGTQTSTRASKAIVGEVTNTAAAMAVIRNTPIYQFTYKSGAYNGETFFGIVTDDSPLFGMDGGKSFNPVTAFGATVLALRDLDARVAALEARQ